MNDVSCSIRAIKVPQPINGIDTIYRVRVVAGRGHWIYTASLTFTSIDNAYQFMVDNARSAAFMDENGLRSQGFSRDDF